LRRKQQPKSGFCGKESSAWHFNGPAAWDQMNFVASQK
jgi:hypothetical protein